MRLPSGVSHTVPVPAMQNPSRQAGSMRTPGEPRGAVRGKSMAELNLSNGGVTLVDDELVSRLSRFTWFGHALQDGAIYVKARVHPKFGGEKGRHTFLHRYIMAPPAGFVVDHISGDTLDNRRAAAFGWQGSGSTASASTSVISRRRMKHMPQRAPGGILHGQVQRTFSAQSWRGTFNDCLVPEWCATVRLFRQGSAKTCKNLRARP